MKMKLSQFNMGMSEAFDWFARGFLVTLGVLLALYTFGIEI